MSDAFFANALKCIQPWLIFHQIWIFDCNLKPCFVTKFLIQHHKVLNMNVSIFLKLSTQMIPTFCHIIIRPPRPLPMVHTKLSVYPIPTYKGLVLKCDPMPPTWPVKRVFIVAVSPFKTCCCLLVIVFCPIGVHGV